MTGQPQAQESRQSNWLDVITFGGAFLTGVVAYAVIRTWFGKGAQLTVTVCLVAIMVSYAALIVLVPRLRVRKDQAGDNSYYLGLLFTLSSMGFALYDFGAITRDSTSVAGVQQIISNFGIALATTIVGIFMRVALHQMRVDPADLEEVTRIELTEAASRLRSILDTTTTDLSRFRLEMQQRSNDTAAELLAMATRTSTEVGQQTEEALKRLVRGTELAHQEALSATMGLTKNIAEAASETLKAVERLRAVQPPPLLLSKRLERIGEALEAVGTHAGATSAALDDLTNTSNDGAQSVAKAAGLLEDLAARMTAEHMKVSERLSKAVNDVSGTVAPFATSLQQLFVDFGRLEEQSKQTVEESVKVRQAAVEVLNDMTSVARNLTETLQRP